jgi:hypothetical protein
MTVWKFWIPDQVGNDGEGGGRKGWRDNGFFSSLRMTEKGAKGAVEKIRIASSLHSSQ